MCAQAVEYFVEWALSPTNAVFLRVQTGVYDPSLVGDKAKWFSHLLAQKFFQVYDESSTLAAALELQTAARPAADNENRSGLLSEYCHHYSNCSLTLITHDGGGCRCVGRQGTPGSL